MGFCGILHSGRNLTAGLMISFSLVELESSKQDVASDEVSIQNLRDSLESFCGSRRHGLELRLALRDGGAVRGIIDKVNERRVTLERADESVIGTSRPQR